MEVSATLRQVEPWKSRLWATSSVAARWDERWRTTTSPVATSDMFTCGGEDRGQGWKEHHSQTRDTDGKRDWFPLYAHALNYISTLF